MQPIATKDLTRMASGFGMRTHPITKERKMHNGMDFTAKIGTDIFASASGTVTLAKREKGNGLAISILHNEKYQTNYYHLSKMLVEVGDKVEIGIIIGEVGDTGRTYILKLLKMENLLIHYH